MRDKRPSQAPGHQTLVAESRRPLRRVEQRVFCGVCGAVIRGEPAGQGLLVWCRGEERRYEEPALCERCAPAISAAGFRMLEGDGDED